MDLDVVAQGQVTTTIIYIIYIMVGEHQAELPIKHFYTPNLAEEVGHAFIGVKPIEPKEMYQEREKNGILTPPSIAGY